MGPIIKSLLDIDLYKLTMSQLAWLKHPRAYVQFGFVKRTHGVDLPAVIPLTELKAEFDAVRRRRFQPIELEYMRSLKFPSGQRMFTDGFVDFLAHTRLQDILVEPRGESFRIEVECYWPEVTLWETIVLSIVNELYNRNQLYGRGYSPCKPWLHGMIQFDHKLRSLQASGLSGSLQPRCLVEFGTRRRFSSEWQKFVLMGLMDDTPQLLAGTSNVNLAREFGLQPIGTFAHEMDMVYSGLCGEGDVDIHGSHQRMLADWWEVYGEPLSIALTDTYGTEFFFDDFTAEQARNWRGFRHDSGPWRRFGDQVLAFYRRHGIDPATKTIVWSDGLTAETIIDIDRTFGRQIKCVYGWGTNLTNDFGPCSEANYGVRPLSIVMKVTQVDGYHAVKLSDNPAKAIGPAEEVARFKRVFGYDDSHYAREECTY